MLQLLFRYRNVSLIMSTEENNARVLTSNDVLNVIEKEEERKRANGPSMEPVLVRPETIVDEDDRRTVYKLLDIVSMTGGVLKLFSRHRVASSKQHWIYTLKFVWGEKWIVNMDDISRTLKLHRGVINVCIHDAATLDEVGLGNALTACVSHRSEEIHLLEHDQKSYMMDHLEDLVSTANKRKRDDASTEESQEIRYKRPCLSNDQMAKTRSSGYCVSKAVTVRTVDGKTYNVPYAILHANCAQFRERSDLGEWSTKGFSVSILSKNFERLYSTMRYGVFPDDDDRSMTGQEIRELEADCIFYGVKYKKASSIVSDVNQ